MRILSVLLFILLISCNKDDNPANTYNFGTYRAVQMTSDTPIDADFDGIYSTDFLQELVWSGHDFRNTLKFIPDRDNKFFSFLIMLAVMHKNPTESIYEDHTALPDFLTRGLSASFNSTGELKTYPMIDQNGNLTETKVIDYKIIDKETIMLKFYYTFIYDIPSSEWKNIIVEGIYKKTEY